MKKYELTNETIGWSGTTLHRIKALRDFADVKVGDLGGFVENEDNLSHDGDCWIYDKAKVFDDAHVHSNAKVYDNAMVFGNASVFGNTEVYSNAKVWGDARVYNYAMVWGNARVFGNTDVYGGAMLYGNAHVYGVTRIGENGKVDSNDDFLTISNIGLRNDNITFYKNINNGISVTCGCFQGTIDEFEKYVSLEYDDNKESYQLAIQLAELEIV